MRYRDAPNLFDNGFKTVVPARGKHCGKGWNRWQDETTPRHLVEAWAATRPHDNIALIMNGAIVAIDLDHDDPGSAFPIRQLANEYLGDCETWRTRKPGCRSLRLYRPAQPDMRTQHHPDIATSVYVNSGLVILFGAHPNGNEYEWPEQSPADIGPDDLPAVSQEAINEFLSAVRVSFPELAGVAPHERQEHSGVGCTGQASFAGAVGSDDVLNHYLSNRDDFGALPAAARDYVQHAAQRHPAVTAACFCLASYGFGADSIAAFIAPGLRAHPKTTERDWPARERELTRSAKGAVARIGG